MYGRGIWGLWGAGEPEAVPLTVKPNPKNITRARAKVFKVWFFIGASIRSFEFLPSPNNATLFVKWGHASAESPRFCRIKGLGSIGAGLEAEADSRLRKREERPSRPAKQVLISQ